MNKIKEIDFSFLSPEEMRKLSVTKIVVPDTYDEDGYPIQGGLADQRLGVIDPSLKCKTCGGSMKTCRGHFGHIELVRPVVHVSFAKTVYLLLKAVCSKCSRVMSDATSLKEVKRVSVCPHCGEKQPQITFVKPTSFYEGDRKLFPNEIRDRLERISDHDLKQLGVNVRPEWFVLTVLLVPPVNVRPSITLESGERSEDDLTHKLVDILRINQRLGENIDSGAPQLIIEDLWELLQYHVTTYFNNETSGIPPARHRSGRQLKTLFQRLKTKEGRFKYNLAGKRVNFSARTIISPNPTLPISVLGVPQSIADELTVPWNVTNWNLEEVKKFIQENPERVSYTISPDGKRRKITPLNIDEILKIITAGWIIERKMKDGDIVLFNRQPSLHRVSILSLKAKIIPGNTFQFNDAITVPFNADFDGDEMNLHLLQEEEAQVEADQLMSVRNNILSPRSGRALILPGLDFALGLYLLSTFYVDVNKEEAEDLLSRTSIKKIEGKKFTGNEIFSMILPKNLVIDENGLVIKDGQLKKGVLNKKNIEKITTAVFKQCGPEECEKFIDNAIQLSIQAFQRFGVSLSIDDYKITEPTLMNIINLYKEGNKQVKELIKKYHNGKLEKIPGKTLKETLEQMILEIAENVRDNSFAFIEQGIKYKKISSFEYNPPLMISVAGKGSRLNVIQIAGLLGQQAVRGKRPISGYKGRLLPHFKKGDLSLEARGFVRNSFSEGLTLTQYFFHACGGRDSVVDKGVNPANTGYMQSRLVYALQDLVVAKDLSVRDAQGRVFQFKYGDDGLDVPTQKPVAYGEAVGVVAAQSLGEPGTQMSLRSFHYAGVASVAQFGFQRLVEIVDARKTPKKPVMEVYLKDEYKSYEAVKRIAASIEQVKVEDVSEIVEDFSKKIIELHLDSEAMSEKNISPQEIVEKISKDNLKIELKKNIITITPEVESLKNLRKITNKIRNVIIKGVEGITKGIIINKNQRYVIVTEGSNLQQILKRDEVDPYLTSTNDFMEILRVLGVEAARNSIIEELQKVLQSQDIIVDVRHLMLIADAMTFNGEVQSVGRHGLAGSKASVLVRAAFEEVEKHLIKAAVEGQKDELTGVTENIFVGNVVPVGTGVVDLEMDVE